MRSTISRGRRFGASPAAIWPAEAGGITGATEVLPECGSDGEALRKGLSELYPGSSISLQGV
jgi:hypothetical protein